MSYLPGYKSTLELLFASTPAGVGKVFIPVNQSLARVSAVSTPDGAVDEGTKLGINHILYLQKSAEQDIEIYLPPDVQLIADAGAISSAAYSYASLMLGLIAPGYYTHLVDNSYEYSDALDRASRTGDLILWFTQEPLPSMISDGEGGRTSTDEIISGTNCVPIEHLKAIRYKNRQRTILLFSITPQLETAVAVLPSLVWSVCNHLGGLKRAKNLMSIRANINLELDTYDSDRLGLVRIIDEGIYKISFDFTDLIGYHGLILIPKGTSRLVKNTKYEVISFPGFY